MSFNALTKSVALADLLVMCVYYPKGLISMPRFTAFVLLFVILSCAFMAGNTAAAASGLSQLNVVKILEENNGDFSDLFVNLKENRDFALMCQKHRLDDPATWPVLRKRFVLNLAELQENLSQAESMMAVQDKRGGLNNQIVSAEKTRAKGKALRNKAAVQMDSLRQMLRLIGEFEAVLREVSENHALTGEISIKNKAGQGFPGKVLLVDGQDLIVKRKDAGYYRIPVRLLDESTVQAVWDPVFTEWKELPGVVKNDESADLNAGELIAYSDSHLYIEDRYEGFVAEKRSDSEFVFVPFEEQLEAGNENLEKDEIQKLQEAMELNQSRVASIDWYDSRLGIEVSESERKEARAYREEKLADIEKTSAPDVVELPVEEVVELAPSEEVSEEPADAPIAAEAPVE